MKRRYKIIIAIIGVAAGIHFGGPLLLEGLIALHS